MGKTYFKNGHMCFKLEAETIHGFIVTGRETAWIHRQVSEFDLIDSVQISEDDYLAQVKKFADKVKLIVEKWQ